MEIRPVSGLDERAACLDIFLRTSNDIERKRGEPPLGPQDVAWMPASIAHFAQTDPERLVVAIRDGEPIGFGCAYQRERFWGLAYLYVLPDSQGAGVGRAMMDALLPPEPERSSMNLATAPEANQSISTMFYARYGIVPRVPLYWLDGLPGIDGLPELPEEVRGRPLSLDEHQPEIDVLDRDVLGYARPKDHRMWVGEAERARVYAGDDGSLVGYGYLSPDDWLAPVASLDETITAGIVRDLLTDHPRDVRGVTVPIAGTAGRLLPLLVSAGMRADEGGAKILYSSNGRVPAPAYLFYAGFLM